MNDPDPQTPSWLRAAASMPVAFAQVREDPLLDRWVVERCAADRGGALEVALIASGGCTAALLATLPQVARLHLVDPNPAQLALARLKLRLLATRDPAARLALLGHTALPAQERAALLRAEFAALGLAADALGPLPAVAHAGPDHVGRYELLFAALRELLRPQAAELRAVLTLADLDEQSRRCAPGTALGAALDAALATALAQEHLVRLFGAAATGNAIQPFHRHFAERLRHALATQPAAANPWLWQMLAGAYPAGAAAPWLAQPRGSRMADVHVSCSTMDAALAGATAAYDVVHLSNILDWLPEAAAAATLAHAFRALRPGGWVVIRQLNSTLDVPGLAPGLAWRAEAAGLHAGDRSFFYRALHLGRRP